MHLSSVTHSTKTTLKINFLILLKHLRFDNVQHDVTTPIPGDYSNSYMELGESSLDTYDKKTMGHQGVECNKTDTEGYEIPVNTSQKGIIYM